MNLSHLIFFVGLALLGLFLWYFGTESSKKKRNVGTTLTLLLTAFCVFGILYTGHYPDNYSVLLTKDGAETEGDIGEQNRIKAKNIVSEILDPDGIAGKAKKGANKDPGSLAVSASKNTIFFSRANISAEEIDKLSEKFKEADLTPAVTQEPKPKSNIKRGIDLQGGSEFVVQLGSEDDQVITDSEKEQAVGVFEKRLNPEGTKDLLIATQGEDRILIQMPGVKPEEIETIRQKIQQVAKLEFRMVNPNSEGLIAQKDSPGDILLEPGWTELPYEEDGVNSGRTIVVRNRPDLEGEYVTAAGVRFGNEGWEINLNFNSEGADRFFKLTQDNVNQRMAIILDKVVISAPNIIEPIGGGTCRINGDYELEDALALASALENPLGITPVIVNESSVSATYGSNTIKQGIYAGIAGLGITLIFIVIYYKIAGLIALIGLTLNIIILLGSLAMFDLTLTMPGIAGIVLTIGIAVDANVLIYERLREELQAGRSLGMAIKAAYNKAFSAIFDANITTLITSLILFAIASGQVKGFAVTLTIGILASLFTALLVTRVCFAWLTDSGFLKQLRLWSIIPDRTFDVLGKRGLARVVSIVLVLIAAGTFGVKQKNAFGVDFLGGELVTLNTKGKVTETQVKKSLDDLPITAITQSQSSPAGDSFVTVRTAYLDQTITENKGKPSNAQLVIDELKKDLSVATDDLEKESVGPVVGKELARSSLLALSFGILGILFYLTVRFEISFALGAIVALAHDVLIALGVVVLLGYELQLIHVGAFLTIAGYSINDTIVVFDRIRETLRQKRGDVKDIMNLAISQTLGRTVLTSLTTFVVVLTLAIFGGPSLRDFAVTIMIGVIIGTYSSVFVAAPVVLWWSDKSGRNLRREILDADEARTVDMSGVEKEVPTSS